MLHIILLILKIIGLIIVCAAGLLLLALCLILFVPVRYSVRGSYLEKKAEGTARLTWLLHAVSIRAFYDAKKTAGKAGVSVKIMGITLFDTERKKTSEKKKQKKSSKKNEEKTDVHTITVDTAKEEKKAEEKQESPEKMKKIAEAGGKDGASAKAADGGRQLPNEKIKVKDKQPPKKQSRLGKFFKKLGTLFKKLKEIPLKIKGFFGSLKEKAGKLGQKLGCLCRKKDRLLTILYAPENRAAFAFLKHSLLKVLRHVLPTKICGKIHFGMEDPEKTGSLLGKAAWLYPLYDGKLKIEPDFEKEVFETDFFLSGRIQAFTLLLTGIKIVLNKELRRILSEVKHL